MHPREYIRKAIVARLSQAKRSIYPTMARDKVYSSRAKPLFDQFLPAILVYTSEERIEESKGDGFSPTVRNLTVDIECVVQGRDDLDDKLDTFAWEVEFALDNWNIPARHSDVINLRDTQSSIMVEGNKLYGAVKLTYSIIYRTRKKVS